MDMQKVIVGGTFDHESGKPSYIVDCLAKSLGQDWTCINGGNLETLEKFDPVGLKALIWMPNISNEEVKTLGQMKIKNPDMVLIQSKRVIEKVYQPEDVMGRIQKSQSAMGIMITKEDGNYRYRLLDNSGAVIVDTPDISAVGQMVKNNLARYFEV